MSNEGKCIVPRCNNPVVALHSDEVGEDKCQVCKDKSAKIALEVDYKFAKRRARGEFERGARAEAIQKWIHDPNAPATLKASDIINGTF